MPPRLVILGGGFAGLNLARGLRRAPIDITLIDRRNHHLFQPLLYQVATASLSPADIAWPIRNVLSRQTNARVLLGEAVEIDPAARLVHLTDGTIEYDLLAICTGVSHSYFGHDHWAPFAPGLKTVDDAVEIRRRFLLAFEAAERETDPAARRARLTFIVVGGGPTGVELAGAMAEIARKAIPPDFRSIDTATARIILVEASDRLLGAMPAPLAARAKRDLEQLGVEVVLGKRVTSIDRSSVTIDTERLDVGCVLWAAGVAAEPLSASLGVPLDRAGRVPVNPDLTVPGHPEIFILGDLAIAKDAQGNTIPGIAPAAMQMGRYAAKVIAKRASILGGTTLALRQSRAGRSESPDLSTPPFRFHDKGQLATIGRARAVGVLTGRQITGFLAWFLWAAVHVSYLVTARSRLLVLIQWAWEYFFFQRGARLITGSTAVEPRDHKSPA